MERFFRAHAQQVAQLCQGTLLACQVTLSLQAVKKRLETRVAATAKQADGNRQLIKSTVSCEERGKVSRTQVVQWSQACLALQHV
jgi:hypothetical protein